MTKMKWDDIVSAIEDEARRMHHNASLLGLRIDDEEKGHLFDAALEYYLYNWLTEKSAEMQKKFGVDLKLTTYGRSGATIAPEGWWDDRGFSHGFDVELNWENAWSRNLDGYNEDLRALRIMQWVNDEVEAGVRGLPEWWKEEREYWGEDDDSAPDVLPLVDEDVLDALEMMAL